jgi:hypothetical protein
MTPIDVSQSLTVVYVRIFLQGMAVLRLMSVDDTTFQLDSQRQWSNIQKQQVGRHSRQVFATASAASRQNVSLDGSTNGHSLVGMNRFAQVNATTKHVIK